MDKDKQFSKSDRGEYDDRGDWDKPRKPFHLEGKHSLNDAWLNLSDHIANDMVDRPAHYTHGKYEAIDIIEDAIEDAPSVKDGFLQAQTLKYLLRLWHKIDSLEDAKKARWYLNRLIDSLE